MTDDHFTFSGHQTGQGGEIGPGTVLGNYELREPLGQGGMGQVWKAWDTPGRREVALKLLPKEFRGNPEALEQVRESFEQVHALAHQSIGKTLGLLEDPVHGPYLVMDLIPGVTLSSFARQARKDGKKVGVKQAVNLLAPVAEALDYAHQRKVLHRDVKPQNILVQLQPFFQVTLIDFGLAAAIRSTLSLHTKGTVDTRGTRPYMSPEQIRGKSREWDHRTDQYSLAVVAYELLGGRLPFESDDDFALMYAVINELADPLEALPEGVNLALLKGLSKQREDRFGSCHEFIHALAEPLATTFQVASASPVAQPLTKPAATPPQPDPPVVGKQAGDLWEGNSLGMKFRWCPPGSFTMGSPKNEPDRQVNEDQVQVTLTRGFWLGQYPVTQAEYEVITGKNPSHFKRQKLNAGCNRHPVEQVNWEEAMKFCQLLTGQELAAGRLPSGWKYSLPTEAQWEYACRAGTTTATAFGDKLDSTQANFDGNHPYNGAAKRKNRKKTTPVGSYQPNAWNLYDMHGNVWEWCRDSYVDKLPGGTEPEFTGMTGYPVSRGGSWNNSGWFCRSAHRFRRVGLNCSLSLGFRVAAVQAR